MNDISSNIKKVLFVFLLLFIVLISYMTYFEIYKAPGIENKPTNKRLWAKRNEVLRGTIYDRNQQALTKSERVNTLTQKREYTGGPAFAHVLGYLDPIYGITGLEKKYDSELMADDTSIIKYFSFNQKKEEKIGHDLITTLDMDLQKNAFDSLDNHIGSVVALNPQTGEILAMVSKPSFDPNNLKATWSSINADKSRPLLNRAVSGLYPPGSTFKTITAISAIDNISGIKDKSFEDNGRLPLGPNAYLRDFEGEMFGTLSFKESYVKSSNVVFGGIGLELGNANLKNTAESFYFNKEIPCDGIIIDKSIFPQYGKYEKGNIAQSAIGQSGVLATPMQMALVASSVANNGVMMKPYLVSKVMSNKGKVIKEISPTEIGTVASKDDAVYMKGLMRAVVAGGTGSQANIPGLNVCGKTGTAENNTMGKGSVDHSWFIAFAPYDNPKIAIAVIIENGGQGGEVAAPIAGKLIKAYLKK